MFSLIYTTSAKIEKKEEADFHPNNPIIPPALRYKSAAVQHLNYNLFEVISGVLCVY